MPWPELATSDQKALPADHIAKAVSVRALQRHKANGRLRQGESYFKELAGMTVGGWRTWRHGEFTLPLCLSACF